MVEAGLLLVVMLCGLIGYVFVSGIDRFFSRIMEKPEDIMDEEDRIEAMIQKEFEDDGGESSIN